MKLLDRDNFERSKILLAQGKIKAINEKDGYYVNYEEPSNGCQSDHYPTLEAAKDAAQSMARRLEGNRYADREHYPKISKDFIVYPLDTETRYRESHQNDIILDYWY
jgi:hypothetical protein